MKKILIISAAVLLLALATGCTQNNGHIGDLFGSWALESSTLDGAAVSEVTSTTISFQGSIVQFNCIYNEFELSSIFGQWSRSDNQLTLVFNSGSGATPGWMGIAESPAVITLERLTSSEMIWVYTAPGGEIYRYRFGRTW